MPATPLLLENHSLRSTLVFQAKAVGLMARRGWHNLLAGPRRFGVGRQLVGEATVALSESDLWNPDDNARNWLLTAGKVHNLRRAARQLHGLEVPAGALFSFWAQVGNPNLGRGYVLGREIREGCVVPTIAGGLCQLSNALYDAALQAGFAIVERHRHSRIIPGSLAERDRDATVKWNYIDLRFRAAAAFRIEVELTADKLRVAFKGPAPGGPAPARSAAPPLAASTLNDCFSCGNLTCFKHPGRTAAPPAAATTTYILDEKWPEYEAYVREAARPQDYLLAPWLPLGPLPAPQPGWQLGGLPNCRPLLGAAWLRTGLRRLLGRAGANVFALSLPLDRRVAQAAARSIPLTSTHVVVSQNLLPFLWETGALGGRTFDVLMTRLPLQHLHERLDAAHQQHPSSPTLHDFRAPHTLIDLENQALTRARQLITPHQEIASLFTHKALKLAWLAPAMPPARAARGSSILFPASAVGRKGAYEVRRLAEELQLRVVLTGRATEEAGFWGNVATEWAGANPLANCALVVYPAYVEHQPRLLLRALAAGVPVVATPACGLPPAAHLTLVPAGDYEALKQAVQAQLGR
ncbi:MAG: VanW family protein [Janthinobacterium lividum]